MYKRKRDTMTGRVIRRNLAAKTVEEAVGPIEKGIEIFGLSKGQFSLIDIISHCLKATGPADVTLSTWTAANADMGFAYELLREGSIHSLKFVVDFSFPTRQPEYCAALREKFGDDAVRVTKTHANFVVIRNADWSIVIRSSMNLNENRRFESFEISDDPGMAKYCEDLVFDLFEYQEAGKGFEDGPYKVCQQFLAFNGNVEGPATSTDEKKYFGNGRYSNDIRRAGVTRPDAKASEEAA
jgi:hypothetical protein